MTDRDTEQRMRDLIGEGFAAGDLQFEPAFADRVMARLAADTRTGDLATSLVRQGRRMLPALIAASIALVAWNWTASRGTGAPLVSAALGLSSSPTNSADVASLQGAEAFQ
jgi:hypothetical protein